MNLQKLVSSIVEAIIEVDYSEKREDVCTPHETYEDTLALAVINSILEKYNADLDVEDRKNETRNKDSYKWSSVKKAGKPSYNRVRQNPAGSSSLDMNHNSKDNIGTTKNINNISKTSFSDMSSDTSSSFSDTSSETSLSSDSSLASTTTPSRGTFTTNKFFDPFVELYLTKSHPEIWENNWTLKVHDEAYGAKQHNKISLTSWRKRLNVRKSLQVQFENLTDDVKTALEQRNCNVLQLQNINSLCTERKENELTEQKFYNSVWFWTSQTLICQDGEYFVKIGDDIGESSTDDDNLSKCVDDNSLIPVMQAVKLFEALQKI